MTCVEEYQTESMKSKTLRKVIDTTETDKENTYFCKMFRLGRDNTRTGSTIITFTQEGINIHGDLCPSLYGINSCPGYGVGWFGSQLSEGYLCEKFLRKNHTPDSVVQDLKNWLEYLDEDYDDERKDKLKKLISDVENGWVEESDSFEIHDRMIDIEEDAWEHNVGWGYDKSEKSWLCAIQQRFAELYQKGEY